ncbi:MAG TPA: DUF3027 domain-containing protein [Streptosporangiaceae bacterium]
MSTVRMRTREPDEVCAQAVDLARTAAGEAAGASAIGDHVGMEAEADRVVTHLFRCLDPAYLGWHWAVTVARASRAKNVTVSESLLVPGPEAILAPAWVPWRDRVRPGDLGVGDILPAPADDERLVPSAALEGEDGMADPAAADLTDLPPALADLAGEVANDPEVSLSRARVLSAIGRDEAAIRWYTGEHGPRSPLAHAAPGPCRACGFFVRLGGPLGQLFGVCANSYAPDDGRVVSADHGCGAHSEGVLPMGAGQPVVPIIDELGYDLVDHPGVSVEETVFESLDHG